MRYKIPSPVAQHEQICCMTSCKLNEKRETKKKKTFVLLKVEPRFTFRNKFPEPATNVFVTRQVDHAK